MKNVLSGILLSTFIGVLAMFIAPYIPMVNAIVLALLFGIVITNIFPLPSSLDPGVHFSGKTVLEIAIIFLGFGISFQDIQNVGWSTLLILIFTILVVLLFAFYFSKKTPDKAICGYLVGFGTAICGSSAIAALAPKIKASKNEIGISIAVINLMGLIGMVTLPLALNQSMNIAWGGLFIGGTLHGVSNVAGAGYAINESIGDLALTIKLGRVALLAPSLIFFNFLVNKTASIKENLKLPYYIIGFISASTLVSIFQLPDELISTFRMLGKLFLTISMAAIGLNIQFRNLMEHGKSAIKFGIVFFAIQLAVVGLLGFLL